MYKHRFDPVSFVFGMAFVVAAVMFVVPADPWEIYFGGLSLRWVWPALLVVAGIALLAPILRSSAGDPDPAAPLTDTDDTKVGPSD